MAQFIGRYEHSLDDKGRLILPAKFRPQFEHGGFISQFRDGCLALWTPDDFALTMAEMKQSGAQGKDERNLARVWASGSQEVEVDKRSGRMAIASYLREFAELTGDVLVLGAIDRVELWNPELWEEKVKPSEASLLNG